MNKKRHIDSQEPEVHNHEDSSCEYGGGGGGRRGIDTRRLATAVSLYVLLGERGQGREMTLKGQFSENDAKIHEYANGANTNRWCYANKTTITTRNKITQKNNNIPAKSNHNE